MSPKYTTESGGMVGEGYKAGDAERGYAKVPGRTSGKKGEQVTEKTIKYISGK